MDANADRTVAVEDARSFKEGGKPTLFAARKQVYPRKIAGTFRRFKWAMVSVLLTIYYVTPWLRWDRGPGAPDQAVLIDMPARRAYFFFIEIWPQEVYYLTGILILAAVGLFLMTSLMGRVWCAYGCPQTVWTDIYMWVEHLIEGDRSARIRLDMAPPSWNKALKRISKHAVWLIIAVATGGAWIFYFKDAPTAAAEIFTGSATTTIYFFIGLFTATTYLLAGWMREQVCTYMCPWPRIQAAMFDEHTLIVTYQAWRGEPRGPHRKGDVWEGRGDCVACNLCVAVCPTGIDIRDGNQLECIGCGLCVDACNTVMDRAGRPGGLVKFDTRANQDRLAAGERKGAYRLARPRTIFYGLLLLLVSGLMLQNLLTRSTLDLNVQRDRNPLFVTLSDGTIQNGYTVKALNMTFAPRRLRLELEGMEGAEMVVAGRDGQAVESAIVDVPADSVATYRVLVRMPAARARAEARPFAFVLTDAVNAEADRHESVFRGPAR